MIGEVEHATKYLIFMESTNSIYSNSHHLELKRVHANTNYTEIEKKKEMLFVKSGQTACKVNDTKHIEQCIGLLNRAKD